MRRSTLVGAALAAALAAIAGPAAAAVTNLSELLEQTKNLRALQAQANAAREREFLANRDQQQALVEKAQRARDAAEARSNELSKHYDETEVRITEQQNLLNTRLGSLGELFGVVRQVSGDVTGSIENSLISAEFPGRADFFAQLSKAKELPSIATLEQLWFEMQREMTESGRVARFETGIVDADGATTPAEVVRVGGFIAMSDGRYLTYLPGVKKLSLLPRQPAGRLTGLAKELQEATSGYVEAAVDPSRGPLLMMYVQRPTWVERIQHGESINYVILAVGFAGAVCFVLQLFYLVGVRVAVSRQLRDLDRPRSDNPLGRVLGTFKGDPNRAEEDAEVIELRISEAVLREVPKLERFQAFLRLAVAAGPLLGLIGTVIGMIITFQSITESGSSDPRLMANGISTAMIATVLGLGISIPLLFANALLSALSRTVVQTLDEQSTGLLAESIERKTGA
jgi:biopolymer transport protein ExbB